MRSIRSLAVAVATLFALACTSADAHPLATESAFLQVEDDVRIFYQRFGTGTPTIFVPMRVGMVYALEPLLGSFDMVFWDPRGFGLSDRPDDLSRYGLDAELSDAEALRHHFGADGITYVGISLWGAVAMLYAARHPEAVERVVAMGPLPVQAAQMGPPDRPIDHGLEAERVELAAMEADGRMASDPYAYCVLEAYVGGSTSHVDIEAMRIPAKGNGCQYPNDRPDRVLPVVFDGIIGSFGDWDWGDQIASVTQPTILLFGDHEAWPQAGVQAYAPLLQDVGWLEVERSGHAVWNDANELMLEMLDTFFRGAWPDGVNR